MKHNDQLPAFWQKREQTEDNAPPRRGASQPRIEVQQPPLRRKTRSVASLESDE